MTDKVTNWYSKLKTQSVETRVDKTFKNHRIFPCSMIACIGQTGCGKSNSLIDFLHRVSFKSILLLLANHQCCHFSAILLNTGIFLN
jgi:hypothetical protein